MNRRTFVHRTAAVLGLGALAPSVLTPRPAYAAGDKIRVGQIGTAHGHARGKMASLRRLTDYDVVGVVEPDPERRAAAQRDAAYQGLPWLTEEQLFETKGVQVVAVETAVNALLATASRVVAAGMHVHLDKPAGESLPAFKQLLEEATRRKLTVQMGYMFRYNPAVRKCIEAVREGWLGQVFSVDAVMGKVVGATERQALKPYRGGAMFELGCHVMDAIITILGAPQRVTAHQRHSSTLSDGLADNQLAILEYANAVATVRSNFVEVEGNARRHLVVCGDEGTFDIRPLEPPHARLALSKPRPSYSRGYQELNFPDVPRYDADLMDLARVVRGEKALEYTPAHDLVVQETVLRASGLPVD